MIFFVKMLVCFLAAHAADADLVKYVRLSNEGRIAEAYAGLLKEVSALKPVSKNDELHVHFFALGNWAMQLKKWSEARPHLETAIKYGQTNAAQIQYLIGHSYKEEGDNQKAVQAFNRVFLFNPPMNISYDTKRELSEMAMQMGQIWKARENLQYLERRWRGTPQYPEVIWQLMLLEFQDNRRHLGCKWARKLYARYPADSVVKGWGVDLQQNRFGEKTVGCIASQKELRSRIQHLRLSGLENQARKEIDILKARSRPDEVVKADMLLAEHLENQGYPGDALKILTSYYVTAKHDLNFLTLFGKIAARAGEFQTAIGAYYSIYKSSPRSRLGRNALFTSAYLSYQIQDYDGAYRKFTEVTHKHNGSALARDARWHLAWLQYLKGNYASAEKAYRALAEEKIYKRRRRVVRPFQNDRTRYWLAMSLLKQDKKDNASKIFTQLAEDKSYSFYSLLAQARLNQSLAELKEGRTLANVVSGAEAKIDEDEDLSVNDESEENIQVGGTTIDEASDKISDEVSDKISDEPVPATTFGDPRLRARFNAANNLILLGLNEWAKWELYEIERRTANKAYLKMLMDAYAKIGFHHRSMYIAEIYFGRERQKLGIHEGREYWVHNYPQAYSDRVDTYAKKFNVSPSLVFAIMRAESQFNKEALSPVGAQGLMQIMPYTAAQIFQLLEEKRNDNTTTQQNLFLPDVNIRLGTRYLSRLQKKLQGQIPLVAAAYNAGPHRVLSWLSTFGNLDMDEFIEHVPFVETRNYIKKVIRNYAVYNELYGPKHSKYRWLTEPVPLKVSERPSPRENWDSVD